MKNYKLEDDRFKHESFYQLSSVFSHSLSVFLLEERIIDKTFKIQRR